MKKNISGLALASLLVFTPIFAFAHHSDDSQSQQEHHKKDHHKKDKKQKPIKLRHETTESIDQKIQDGVTTKAQIKALFGTPQDIQFNEQTGNENWIYIQNNSHLTAAGWLAPIPGVAASKSTAQQLKILFHGEKVWHHFLTSGKSTSDGFSSSQGNF